MWILRNYLTDHVSLQTITKEKGSYAEFPKSTDLLKFDRSDRKFVALAKAHPANPPIVNGSDTDWWEFKDILTREGIQIVFLCKEYMKAKIK